MRKREMQDIWPVLEFRPLPSFFDKYNYGVDDRAVHRYANGEWIPDDGEYDLAFAIKGYCLMVELPYQKNILWSWCTGHWSAFEPNHPHGNAWHHMLREGQTEWGGDWGRDLHPNTKAGRSGMNFAIRNRGCANGLRVAFHLNDKHIAAGLLRERDTKKVVTFPGIPVCLHCGPLAMAA